MYSFGDYVKIISGLTERITEANFLISERLYVMDMSSEIGG